MSINMKRKRRNRCEEKKGDKEMQTEEWNWRRKKMTGRIVWE